jgi:sugar phosphate isomerase/epimerase
LSNLTQQFGVTTWTLGVRGVSALRAAKRFDLASVHLDMKDLGSATTQEMGEIKAASQDLGIRLAGISVNRLEETGLSLSNEAMSAVSDVLHAAKQLDIGYVYLPFFERARLGTPDEIARAQRLLQCALSLSEDDGTTIALECTLGAKPLRALIESLSNPRVETLFDTQNLYLAGIDPIDVLEQTAQHTQSFVHVKDGWTQLGNARVGQGAAGVHNSLSALQSFGFSGQYILENDYSHDAFARIEQDKELLSEILKSPLDSGNACIDKKWD